MKVYCFIRKPMCVKKDRKIDNAISLLSSDPMLEWVFDERLNGQLWQQIFFAGLFHLNLTFNRIFKPKIYFLNHIWLPGYVEKQITSRQVRLLLVFERISRDVRLSPNGNAPPMRQSCWYHISFSGCLLPLSTVRQYWQNHFFPHPFHGYQNQRR